MLYRLSSKSPYPVEYVSRNIERYGYSQSQFLSGPESFMELVHPDSRPAILANIADIVSEKAMDAGCDFRLRMPNGSYVWFENRMHPVFDTGRKLKALEGILLDVNDRKIAQTEMTRLTFTDLLTALPNRVAFMEWLKKAFDAAKEGGEPFAVLYVDLDNFKDVNEALGHSFGDALLKAVAQRLARRHARGRSDRARRRRRVRCNPGWPRRSRRHRGARGQNHRLDHGAHIRLAAANSM